MATNEWERERPPLATLPVNELAAALAKAQAEMSNPSFDAQNPHFRNRYASLAAVRNAVIPVLAKHGICATQDVTTAESGVALMTILTHSSGQQMRFGPLILPISKQDAQGFGSAITYARRYQLMAVAGVVGDDDDDAEAAVGRTGNVDPRGEDWRKIDTKISKSHAEAFRKALAAASDPGVYEVHLRVHTNPELYIAVSEQLKPEERRKIKEAVARMKEGGAGHPQNGMQ